ncbi:tyrosine-type recombinase/integrase [Demequina oxidasica]|uniref:tyrosine-type recombinase/integrase n=1 Tax=Demequina oxidasica TaxID=676199 RepID=UPI0007819217|nr:site-specific integrase [Demequina oxidasica]
MAKPASMPRGINVSAEGMFRVRLYWRGKQHSIGNYYTLGDAKAAMAIARSEMARGIFIPPSAMRQNRASQDVLELVEATTVAQWGYDWIERLEGAGRTPATIRSYRSTLKAHIVPSIGHMRLMDVASADIDTMLGKLKATPGAWTNVARVTRSMFLAAISAGAGGITASPFAAHIESTRKRRDRGLARSDLATPAEVEALATAVPESLRVSVMLGAWCAMRQGEVLGLQRRDFRHLEDAPRATVNIARQWNAKATPPTYTTPKAGSARELSIPNELVPMIRDHLERFTPAPDDAPVLPRKGKPTVPVSQSSFDLAWRTAREAVRPGFRFHSLRHTGLTEYARTGATLAELMYRGGHTSAEVAMRYQHASLDRDRSNTSRMSVFGLGEQS